MTIIPLRGGDPIHANALPPGRWSRLDPFGSGPLPVGLGFDALELAVASPPTTSERALQLAAEHRAFCRYNFTQQPGKLREFADGLVGFRTWRFWWD